MESCSVDETVVTKSNPPCCVSLEAVRVTKFSICVRYEEETSTAWLIEQRGRTNMLCSGYTHKAQTIKTYLMHWSTLTLSSTPSLRLKLHLRTLVDVNIIISLIALPIIPIAYSLYNFTYWDLYLSYLKLASVLFIFVSLKQHLRTWKGQFCHFSYHLPLCRRFIPDWSRRFKTQLIQLEAVLFLKVHMSRWQHMRSLQLAQAIVIWCVICALFDF